MEIPPTDTITATSMLLIMAADTEKIVFDRSFDLQQLAGDGGLSPEVDFMRMFRGLKILARLYPLSNSENETGYINVKIGSGTDQRAIHFTVQFHTVAGQESATITHEDEMDTRVN